MLDARKLLDQFLGAGLLGGPGESGGPGSPDALGQAGQRLQDFTRARPLATGAIAGGLAGLLLGSKKGRKLAGNVAAVGGLALLGGLAWKAYREWHAGNATASAMAMPASGPAQLALPADTPFAPSSAGEANRLGLALLSAMIAAAKADGHIDAEEQKRIFDRLDTLSLTAEEKAFVMDELRAPLDIDRIAALARGPEEAAEIYAASRLAIDPDTPAETAYLDTLAAKLSLAPALRAGLDREIAALPRG